MTAGAGLKGTIAWRASLLARHEEAPQPEEHERHPLRRQDLDVSELSEPVGRERVEEAGDECGAGVPGEFPHQQERAEPGEHERREEQHVVAKNDVARDQPDRQRLNRQRKQVLGIEERQRFRVEDAGVPVARESVEVSAGQRHEVIEIPVQQPGSKQWIAKVVRQSRCQRRGHRPGHHDGERQVGSRRGEAVEPRQAAPWARRSSFGGGSGWNHGEDEGGAGTRSPSASYRKTAGPGQSRTIGDQSRWPSGLRPAKRSRNRPISQSSSRMYGR